MTEKLLPSKADLLPLLVLVVAIAIWWALWLLQVFPPSVFPSPLAVAKGLGEEIRTGRLFGDLVASLFRVTTGFMLAVILGVPMGLWLGHHARARFALLPAINFFRSLSPLAYTIRHSVVRHWGLAGALPDLHGLFLPGRRRHHVGSRQHPLSLFSGGARLQLQRSGTVNESDPT